MDQVVPGILRVARDIIGFSDVTLLVPHAVSRILENQKASHMSTARFGQYHTALLDMPNVTVKRCTVLNPASLLPLPDEGEPHDCRAELQLQCTRRPDLSDTPLITSDLVLFVDGSASRDPTTGTNRVGFAVVTDTHTLCSGCLPSNLSLNWLLSQKHANWLPVNQLQSTQAPDMPSVLFTTLAPSGALWHHRKFLKSDGKLILHHNLVAALLEAILLPSKIAVCKCSAHTKATDPVSLGNAKADTAAKAAAQLPPSHTMLTISTSTSQKLAKCCDETGLPWTKALPLALMYMRMRKRTQTNLSPFEVLFAAPPHVGVAPLKEENTSHRLLCSRRHFVG